MKKINERIISMSDLEALEAIGKNAKKEKGELDDDIEIEYEFDDEDEYEEPREKNQIPSSENCDNLFVCFISLLEAYKRRIQEIHWNTDVDKIHIISDELVNEIKGIQDSMAEDYMGSCGDKLPLGILDVPSIEETELKDVLTSLRTKTEELYAYFNDPVLNGLQHSAGSLIKLCNTYLYKETQR